MDWEVLCAVAGLAAGPASRGEAELVETGRVTKLVEMVAVVPGDFAAGFAFALADLIAGGAAPVDAAELVEAVLGAEFVAGAELVPMARSGVLDFVGDGLASCEVDSAPAGALVAAVRVTRLVAMAVVAPGDLAAGFALALADLAVGGVDPMAVAELAEAALGAGFVAVAELVPMARGGVLGFTGDGLASCEVVSAAAGALVVAARVTRLVEIVGLVPAGRAEGFALALLVALVPEAASSVAGVALVAAGRVIRFVEMAKGGLAGDFAFPPLALAAGAACSAAVALVAAGRATKLVVLLATVPGGLAGALPLAEAPLVVVVAGSAWLVEILELDSSGVAGGFVFTIAGLGSGSTVGVGAGRRSTRRL